MLAQMAYVPGILDLVTLITGTFLVGSLSLQEQTRLLRFYPGFYIYLYCTPIFRIDSELS